MHKDQASVFGNFTEKYALSKTLRFELRPVGKTLDHMRDRFRYDESMRTFLADQEIEDAYQALKPVLDRLHEELITRSLESGPALKIDFSKYFELYGKRSESEEKTLFAEEKRLRTAFDVLFTAAAESFKEEAGKNDKGKPILKEKGFRVLTEAGIMTYLDRSAERFSDILPAEMMREQLAKFDGFFTYFSGFSQNRENYYTTKEEKAAAVATRVVHENLPKFCDNILMFRNREQEYVGAYDFLKNLGTTLEMKHGESGEMRPLHSISPELFQIGHFNRCLSQAGIERYNDEIGNANFLINLYNQKQGAAHGLKHFKTLYKQIGCGKRAAPFFALTHGKRSDAEVARSKDQNKEFYSLEELLSAAAEAGRRYFAGRSDDSSIRTISDFIRYLLEAKPDLFGVYWSKAAMNTVSNRYFANWHALKDALKKEGVFKKADKGSEEDVKIPEVIGLQDFCAVLDEAAPDTWRTDGIFFKESLTEAIEGKEENMDECQRRGFRERKRVNDSRKKIISSAASPSRALLEMIFADLVFHADAFIAGADAIEGLTEYGTESSTEIIKEWFDHALAVTQVLKYFVVRSSKVKGEPIDSILDEGLKILLYANDAQWFTWYDATRNFLTRKPEEDAKRNKLKLNFQNSTLAGGWDVNKESENSCVLLRDSEQRMYLAVVTKRSDERGNKKIFEYPSSSPLYLIGSSSAWQKMEYKLLPGPNKMLPKCLLPKSDRKKYGATDEVLSIYDRGYFKKGGEFSMEALRTIIEFYKAAITRYENWNCFGFDFQPTERYEDISQFYSEVEKQGYQLTFRDVNESIVAKWVEEGRIYLFEIRNQDMNDGKAVGHRKNLHTMYWEAVFSDAENRPKLNGEAELFYRRALTEKEIIRKPGKDGKEIIEHFRFAKEKFLFHVPVTLNFCLKDTKINNVIKEQLFTDGKSCFLGIDRGEKHLVYYALVDGVGNLLKQGSLNSIGGKDYNALLEARAGERDFARKNWKEIGTIKELKEGYISLAVREIVDLAVQNQALIVLEKLNVGFKRGRQKIEKSVYQKFELALAKKLNYLVDKTAELGEIGSVTKALQLTPPVKTFGDIDKKNQFGIMLYTRANYTSQTDPATGWTKTIYLKRGSEASIRQEILDTFSDIRIEGKDYVFTYTERLGKEGVPGRSWTLYSGQDGVPLERYRGKRGKEKGEWKVEPVNVVDLLDGLFAGFDKSRSLLAQIKEGKEPLKVSDHTAWESLRYAIDLIQQIRNSGPKNGASRNDDFLLSPVRGEDGGHFDSRVYLDRERAGETPALPVSGDANGAYNIARKGIIMAEHARRNLSLFVSDEEWAMWLAGTDIWESWLKNNVDALKPKKV